MERAMGIEIIATWFFKDLRSRDRTDLEGTATKCGTENPTRASAQAKGLLRVGQHMLTISKPLSAGQARAYHAEEFANARENYYTEGEQIAGEWHGKLGEQWGLRGEVREEHFQRLSEGQP